MAIQTTPHTHPAKNADPAEVDGDIDQQTSDATQQSDSAMLVNTEMAQTAGTRNERVTEYHGSKHNVETATEAGPADSINRSQRVGLA